MKGKIILLNIVFIYLIGSVYAQSEANIWYFGDNAGMDFETGTPIAITDGALATREGCASISDENGDILFYSEGTKVWNKNHQIMQNGTGLLGDYSSTQSAIIVPKPDSDSLYYIFTVPSGTDPVGKLYYSIVDMSLNSGLGKLITKNVLLHQPVVEKVTAVTHSNGTDIWVVTHERDNSQFCSFLVTSSGVSSTAIISDVGVSHQFPASNYVGYMKISPMGNYIACALQGSSSLFEMFDFDRGTGLVSNPITFNNYIFAYGLEFSPDESLLYLGVIRDQAEIFQVNLNAGSPTDIVNSAISIGTSPSNDIGALQIGVDQKIYVTMDFYSYLGIINNPNDLGAACNFVHDGIYLEGKNGRFGLPTFIQSYFSASITFQNTCFGDTTFFDISSSDPIQSISWNFGDPASGSNNTSTQLQPGHVFTASGSYTVTASVIFTAGNTQDFTTEVTIYNVPQINLGNDSILCQGGSLLLDPGSGYSSYLWQDNSVNQLFTATQSGVYWVTVTNNNGCSTTDSITLSFSAQAIVNLGNDSIYCFQPSVTLHAGSTFDTYLWQDGSTDSLLTVYNNGTYWVQVADASGCSGGDTIVISFFQTTVDLGNDTTICNGSSITLDAGGGFVNYLWSTNETTQSIIVNTTGVFDVEASFAYCVSYDTMEVIIQPGAFSYAGSNESICNTETFNFINCNILPTASNYDSLLWFGGLGTFSNTGILQPEYFPLLSEYGDITLSLIAYSAGSCPDDISSMILTIDSLPVAGFILPASSCIGTSLQLSGSSTTNITNWNWDFGDGSSSQTGQTVNYSYPISGNYTVTLIVINDNGCTDTVSQNIQIFDLPTAAYSFLPNDSICVNEMIDFTDNSSSNITSWNWDFDDGNISTQQNPLHSFVTSGNYNVQLSVTDNNICADSVSLPIQINPLPEPDFNILPNDTICAELPIALAGFDIAGTSIIEWNWDFGDGNISALQNPTHTYALPGDYTISLNLLNNNSCTEIKFKQVHIQSLPESNFTIAPNDTSCMGELINFDATNITGDISLWAWEFGDGNTGAGQNVSHTFSNPNSQIYNILSIFQNINGCMDTSVLQRVVQKITIDFDVTQSPSCQNYPVLFTGTNGLVTFTDWNWNFGDGSVPGLGHNESHFYTQPDTVDVQLNVCSEQQIKQLVIAGTCVVDAGSNEATCQDVYFNLNHSTILPTADSFDSIAWFTNGLGYFDDYRLMIPTYFPHPSEGAIQNDTLIMTMIGYGIAPCENDTSTMELIVIPGAYAQAGSDENSCFGVPYDFANSTDSSFATNYATIYWVTSGTGSFVDPNVEHPIYIPGTNEIGSVTLTMVAANIINCDSIDDMVLTIRPTYEMPVDITICYYDSVFAQNAWQYASGIYYDTLLTTNYGCDSVIVTNLTVRPKIDRDFAINTSDSICFGETVAFTSIGTANLASWMWDFGDGITTNLPDPTHQYNAFGDFTIIYYFTDINGCSDSATRNITVFDLPDVDFTVNMTNACVNTQVNFIGTSSSNIAVWDWDFGDGQSGVGQTTSHVYNTWGNMSIILTVTDIHGCSESSMQMLTIAQPPIADFTYESIICDSIQFTNLSTTAPGYTLVESHWNFGDGSPTVIAQDTAHQYPSNTTPGGVVYDVTLLIFADSSGFICTDSIVLPVIVPPLPDIFYTFTPDPTCLGDTTRFFGESGYYINTWHWNFGDGNTALTQYANNLYATTGDYTVILDIVDTLGCANTLAKIVTVNPIPMVSFTMSDSITCHGNAITFIGTGSTNIAVWYWEFGDGTFSYDQNPFHYYTNAGTYTVNLTVTDTAGCSAIATNEVLILPGPTADFSYAAITCSSMVFADQSIAPTNYAIVEWQWDFGDGTTSTVQNPSHGYASGGLYDVTLIVRADSVSSEYSCYDTIIQTINMPGLPSIYFVWDPEPTMLGEVTTFYGTSGNTIIDWYWDFGDGNFATTQDATNIFATIGTFNVELTITDIDGCSNTLIHQVTVTNVPDLDYHWNFACEGVAVQFTVDSPPTDIPAVVSWNWDFGDGANSQDMNPIHNYVASGTYDVSLTIVDTMNATNTVIKTITVNPPPISLFSVDPPTCSGSPVQFTDLSTTPMGFITEWHWDFGDGNTTTVTFPDDPNVTYTYASAATFVVTLTVTNSDSCTSTSTNQVTTIPSPTAMFNHNSGCSSGPVSFTDTSIENSGGTIIFWNWNFDDPGSGPDNISALQNPVHLFTNPGDYNVELIVTNVNGCSDTTTTTVTVAEEPTVDFTYSAACLGSETQFTVDGTVTNIGEVQTWLWSFGDGSTSNLQNPTHIYAASGDYNVTLAIVTTDNCTASVTHTVTINPLPNANFEHTAPACLNDTVYFLDLSSSPNGLITTWHWDFGDGTEITITAPDNPNVSHIYVNNAIYAVTLTVTDSDTCENTIVKQVEVVSSPIADFTYEETCYNDPVFFTDLSTTNGGTDLFSWEWFFGDPNSGIENHSTLQNPTHVFTDPGTYTTTLIVVSTIGCSDTIEQDITIAPLPEVNFTILDDSICLGELAEFTGISNSDISTWYWDFGDGGYSIEQNPTYMYGTPGEYLVTLTVTEIGPDQCQNSISYPIYVNDAPIANFDYNNTCHGDSTYFTDLSYSQNGFITAWLWDFGDGNTSIEEDPIHYYQNNNEYAVTLISTDNYGCSDTIIQWIQVYAKPIPGFSFDQVCEPDGQLNFFDESLPGSDNSPIIGWNWNLYEGYYSTEIDPSYIYPQTDTCYTVILEITDGNGCTATDTNYQVCLHGTLAIDFTSTEECLGQSTFFQATYDPPSDSVASYTWNFNDGSPLQTIYQDSISHIFPNPTTYIVELMAEDTNGCTTTIYHEVTIDSLPTPQFTNTNGSCDTPTEFTDTSFGGGEFIETWSWNFGDNTSGVNNTSTLQHPTHLYGPYDSTYQVKLIVTNFNGCTDSITQDVYVEPCLIADFNLPTEPVCARYDNICFTDLSQLSSNNGAITQWRWDFGDGETENYPIQRDSICHIYNQGGIYTVQLVVVATINGITYNDTVTKTLTVHSTPEAMMLVENSCLGDSTIFYDMSNNNNEPITLWQWDFGDPSSGSNNSSTDQIPKHLYNQTDDYVAQLLVMNQYMCKDSITDTLTICQPPTANFSFTETCMSYYTQFTDESEDGGSPIDIYNWNFGDTLTTTDTTTLQNPQYVYDSTGIYTVELRVVDGNLCYDTVYQSIEIHPIPGSMFNIIDTLQQGQIYLENNSIGSISYYWDFDYDNLISSTEKDPTHQYEEDGTYNIMLVSYNEFNCPDTTYQLYDLLFTNLFVPNAFLPSSTNSELKIFKPTGINIQSYVLEIYSSWGNLVFSSTRLEDGSPSEGWDGTFEGAPLPTGSFIWRISAVFKDGTYWKGSDNGDGNTETNGTITLIR